MATKVSFINFKGGVGKTTICVEIAAALAQKFQERVLIVDLDPQTNATFSLLTEDEWQNHAEEKGTLRDFFERCYDGRPSDIKELIFKSPLQLRGRWNINLDVLPSHIELFGMDLRLATRYGHGDLRAKLFLRTSLEEIEHEYDYIVFDCPPNLYLATQNGLFSSDYYTIVALPEYLSTLGIAHIQKSIRELFDDAEGLARSIGGAGIEPAAVLGIIFNRVRYQTGGTWSEERVMGQIQKLYPDLVFQQAIPQSTRIAERPQTKVPIAISGYAADRAYEARMAEVTEEFYDRITRPS